MTLSLISLGLQLGAPSGSGASFETVTGTVSEIVPGTVLSSVFGEVPAWVPDTVIAVYLGILLFLAVYGFHRSHLVYLYFKYRHNRPKPRAVFGADTEDKPYVTLQLPMFNEMYVVERLLDAAAAIRYPRERFQIQVLDDSTDETRGICERKIAALQAQNPDLDIEYVHRVDRTGFKAGALENGLRTAKGELVLIFDADFVPQPDVLERTVDFFTDPKVAVVQCRWAHLNRDYSALTDAQALMLNGHFVMEHAGRARAGRFFQLQWDRWHLASNGHR